MKRIGMRGRQPVWLIGSILSMVMLTGSIAHAGGPKQGPSPDQPEVKKQAPAPQAPAPKATPAPKKPAPKKPAPKKPAPQAQQAKPVTKGNGNKVNGNKVKPDATKTGLKIRIRARDVYLGRYRSFRKPAVLDCQKVFNSISFYQKVKRNHLNKKSGRYWILMQKANRIFYKALRRLSRERGYDLIGARNSIVINGANPTDVTRNLLEIIPSITLD